MIWIQSYTHAQHHTDTLVIALNNIVEVTNCIATLKVNQGVVR